MTINNLWLELKLRQETNMRISIGNLLLSVLATVAKIYLLWTMCLDEKHGKATNTSINDRIAAWVFTEIWSQNTRRGAILYQRKVSNLISVNPLVIYTSWDSDNSYILIVPFEIQKESIKPSIASSLTQP